ncbi:MAG: winged helix-turn-helix domain-containing protein [Chitinivorax sp.]|jgi:DNA-binding response OmpR family regulator
MRILLVEDDDLLGDGVEAGLKQAGYTVDWVRDGKAGELAMSCERYDAAILDINLPRQSGLEILAKRRSAGDNTPVLLLTARDTVNDRVSGLDCGADDYLVKPFALAELCARLRALTRRQSGRSTPIISHGQLQLDPAAREVRRDQQPVALSPREFSLLELLLEHRGHVLSKTQLESALYGWGEEVESNSVEVHIHHLRKKLGSELIRTMRGVGYMIPKQEGPQ